MSMCGAVIVESPAKSQKSTIERMVCTKRNQVVVIAADIGFSTFCGGLFPKRPPRLNQVVRLVAMVGGFLGRKGDDEPGVKTIWKGLHRVMDVAVGLKWVRRKSCNLKDVCKGIHLEVYDNRKEF